MYKLSKLALNDQDVTKIIKRRNTPLWILGITVLIFDTIFILAINDSVLAILIAVGIFDFLLSIPVIIIFNRTKKDIDAGFKNCIIGTLDRKVVVSTGKTMIPYLFFENEKVAVSYKEFKRVEQGDEVEIHFTFKSKYVLSLSKI